MVQGFVGRGDELALLADLATGVSAGVGGVVLVEGEQGIGEDVGAPGGPGGRRGGGMPGVVGCG